MPGKVHTPRATDWTENGTSSDNTADTITHAAVEDATHYVTHISVASDAAAIFLVTIEDDDTVIWRTFVHNQLSHDFETPLEITRGNKVDIEVAAAGASIATNATLAGYTF